MDFDNRFLARDNDINFNVESRFSQKQLPNRKSAFLQHQQRQSQLHPQQQYYQQQQYYPQQQFTMQSSNSKIRQPQPKRYTEQQQYSNFILQDPPTQRPNTIGMRPASPIRNMNMQKSASPLRNESPIYRHHQPNWRAGSPVRENSPSKASANVTPTKAINLSNPDFSTPESMDSNRSSITELKEANLMLQANNSDTDISEDDDELAREIKVAEELAKKAEMIAARAREKAMKKKLEQQKKALSQISVSKVEKSKPTDSLKNQVATVQNSTTTAKPINAFFEDAGLYDSGNVLPTLKPKPEVRSTSEEFKPKKIRVTREEVSLLINNDGEEDIVHVFEKPELSKQELKQIKKEEEQEMKRFKKFQELEAKRVRKEKERIQKEKERSAKKKEKEMLKAKKEEYRKSRIELIKKEKEDIAAEKKLKSEREAALFVEKKAVLDKEVTKSKPQKKKLTKKERREEAERVRRQFEEQQRKEKLAIREYRKSVSEHNRKSVLQAFASTAVITSENTVPFDASFVSSCKNSDASGKKSFQPSLKTSNMSNEVDLEFHSPTDMLVNGEEDSSWEDYESEPEEYEKKKQDRKSIKSFMKLLHHQSSSGDVTPTSNASKSAHIEAIVPPTYCDAPKKHSEPKISTNCAAAGQHNQNRKSVNKFLFFSKKNPSEERTIKDITPQLQACATGEFDSCFDEDEDDEFTFENSDFTIRTNNKQDEVSLKQRNTRVRTSMNRRSLIKTVQRTPVTPYIDFNEMGYLQDIIEVSDEQNIMVSTKKLTAFKDMEEDNCSISSNDQNSMKQETNGTFNVSPLTNCSSVKSPKSILKSNNSTPKNQTISGFNTVSFCDKVYVKRTYSKESYDRQSDEHNTCTSLDADIIDSIKSELNQFKRQEMPVHRQSLQNTHFFEL